MTTYTTTSSAHDSSSRCLYHIAGYEITNHTNMGGISLDARLRERIVHALKKQKRNATLCDDADIMLALGENTDLAEHYQFESYTLRGWAPRLSDDLFAPDLLGNAKNSLVEVAFQEGGVIRLVLGSGADNTEAIVNGIVAAMPYHVVLDGQCQIQNASNRQLPYRSFTTLSWRGWNIQGKGIDKDSAASFARAVLDGYNRIRSIDTYLSQQRVSLPWEL